MIFSALDWKSNVLETSKDAPDFTFINTFCRGASTHEDSWTIPCLKKKELRNWLKCS